MKLSDVPTLILGISAVIGVSWLMHRRYHIVNPWIRWPAILAPPFVLTPFFGISIERSTVPIWSVADFIFLVSVCVGIIGVIHLLFDLSDSDRWQRLIGPALAIIIYSSALSYAKRAPGYTEAIGKSVFDTIQQQCYMLKNDPEQFVRMAIDSDLANEKTCMGLYTLLTVVDGGVHHHIIIKK